MRIMSDIIVRNKTARGASLVPNSFIDSYMPQANGEFVKVYLYLLRMTQGECAVSLSSVADAFDCTERDVMRALCYWEKQGLVELTRDSKKLTGISLCPVPDADLSAETAPMEETAAVPAAAEAEPEISGRPLLGADERQALQEKEEVCQFLYIAEQYLGRTLTRTDVDNLLYFYSHLHFSADLIEYLVEYCVSRGSRSTRYIETVALSWAKEGITSVEEAKKSASLYSKRYFAIFKAMGIKDRNPVEMEKKMMDCWMDELGLSMELITEACQRTVLQTGQASFPYTDSILREWHRQGVRHPGDLADLDKAHKKRASRNTAARSVRNAKTVEYPHRDYDYEKIKKALFNQ